MVCLGIRQQYHFPCSDCAGSRFPAYSRPEASLGAAARSQNGTGLVNSIMRPVTG